MTRKIAGEGTAIRLGTGVAVHDEEDPLSTVRQKRVVIAIVLSTLASCALFLAQGTTGLLGASLLEIDRAVAVAPPRTGPVTAAHELKDDTQILRRNIFDSETGPLDGEPVVATDETGEGEVIEIDPNAPPPLCDGSMRLVAAVVHPTRQEWSFAAIVGAEGTAKLFRAGQSLDGREILAIGPSRVFMRPPGGAPCHIAMFSEGEAVARPIVRATPVAAADRPQPDDRDDSISSADMEAGITRVNDTTYNVQRGLVDNILSNQAELMRTARIIPHEENGRVVGVKMYGIRRNSLLGRLGVQNGDMLRTINGYDMSSPDSALEAYTRLRTADHLTLNVVRRGQPTTLDYNIQQ